MDIKYKGISKDKIIEIQKLNMPRFGVPVIDDIDIMRENAYRINDCIDKVAEREARNKDIYIVCEMAKLYLETVSKKKKKCCGTCDWYAEFEGVCTNGDSEFRADFRCLDDTCDCWSSRRISHAERRFEGLDG